LEEGLSNLVDMPTEESEDGSCDGRFAGLTVGTDAEYGNECCVAMARATANRIFTEIRRESE